ncbi:putative vacuolar protein-sorting-associated protein 25 [Paratrimastix pyriformis]|uniref:Vacuolar protein-sorting-associated protein 25 n=1 Tax=Paratrimastix pyriformis TaxID=342808 RepID=A0ABQ8UQE1_9EUKA|nr:putative vacuolar protein-sorting-associated protein 25 [Paratrimastix pyriformis]
MSSFVYPPFFHLPPFFTLQEVLATRQKQLQQWGELVLAYAKFHKITSIDLRQLDTIPLFRNDAIHRRVPLDMARLIIDSLVPSGHGSWVDREKIHCVITWRTPDWGVILSKWVDANGHHGQVFTLFELLSGDDTQAEEFHGLDPSVFRQALAALAQDGKATVFQGSDPSADAVGMGQGQDVVPQDILIGDYSYFFSCAKCGFSRRPVFEYVKPRWAEIVRTALLNLPGPSVLAKEVIDFIDKGCATSGTSSGWQACDD